jgi:hypothetical protein
MVDYYKFECDFYYLHYDMTDKLHGTIYRHYSNNIEFIYGSNDKQIFKLDNTDSKKTTFLADLNKLKDALNTQDIIEKNSNNSYLNMYDYNTCHYEKYYKNLSLAYLCNDDNICGLIDIDMNETIINIGILFTFIETEKFDINDIYIKNKHRNNETTIQETKLFKDYLKDKLEPKTKTKSKKKYSTKGGMITYPGITKITTEQDFIYYETLNYYIDNIQNNLIPVVIEYDINNGQFIIVDGNHRVAYHIEQKFEYIPVIIIFKNLTINI